MSATTKTLRTVRFLFVTVLLATCVLPRGVSAQTSQPAAPASPAATASAEAAIDPAIANRAKDWLHRVATANIDRSQLDAKMNAQLTDDVSKAVAAQLGPLGDPVTFRFVETKAAPAGTSSVFHVDFKSSKLYWVFSVDGAGKINGLRFIPDA